jgi:hypothetical protein
VVLVLVSELVVGSRVLVNRGRLVLTKVGQNVWDSNARDQQNDVQVQWWVDNRPGKTQVVPA